MNFIRFFSTSAIIMIAAIVSEKNSNGKNLQVSTQKVRVRIQVMADSSNFIQANVEVAAGTSARDLMDRLFKINYVDFTHRFVNGIAGFMVGPREKKFWRLDIDGEASEVGIADVKINKPMRIRWVMAEIK